MIILQQNKAVQNIQALAIFASKFLVLATSKIAETKFCVNKIMEIYGICKAQYLFKIIIHTETVQKNKIFRNKTNIFFVSFGTCVF